MLLVSCMTMTLPLPYFVAWFNSNQQRATLSFSNYWEIRSRRVNFEDKVWTEITCKSIFFIAAVVYTTSYWYHEAILYKPLSYTRWPYHEVKATEAGDFLLALPQALGPSSSRAHAQLLRLWRHVAVPRYVNVFGYITLGSLDIVLADSISTDNAFQMNLSILFQW